MQDSCSGFESDFNNFFNTRPLVIEWNQNKVDWATYLALSGQEIHSLTSDPVFTDPTALNFSLQAASPAIGKGVILACAKNAGSGKTISVTNADYFSDGFGIGNGDLIVVGNNRVNITAIDYMNHSISIDRDINWNANDAVSFPFTGIAPDMGAGIIQ
jgi:hypothetical protein